MLVSHSGSLLFTLQRHLNLGAKTQIRVIVSLLRMTFSRYLCFSLKTPRFPPNASVGKLTGFSAGRAQPTRRPHSIWQTICFLHVPEQRLLQNQEELTRRPALRLSYLIRQVDFLNWNREGRKFILLLGKSLWSIKLCKNNGV